MDKQTYLDTVDGSFLGEDKWLSAKARAQRLRRQSDVIASRLQSQNIKAFRASTDHISLVDEYGNSEIIDGSRYRHILFLPSVMSGDSRQWKRELQYFLDMTGYARMWVITAGPRVRVGEVKATFQKLNRTLSKLAYELREEWDVDICAARDEITIRLIDGVYWYHCHCHVVAVPRGYLRDGQWTELLELVHKRVGAHWRDCGQIEDGAECAKYLSKIDDGDDEIDKDDLLIGEDAKEIGPTVGLLSLPPEELAQLQKQLFRHQLSRKYGPFRALKKELREKRIDPKKIPEPTDRYDEEGNRIVVWRWELIEKEPKKERVKREKEDDSPPPVNVVVGSNVAAISAPVMQRCIIVLNACGDRDVLRELWASEFEVPNITSTSARSLSGVLPDPDPPKPGEVHERVSVLR